MAKKTIPKTILRDIQRLIKELNKDDICIQRAILFGSYVSGKTHEYSDIDLALVSHDFFFFLFEDNLRMTKATLRFNDRIETHPYTPDDFEYSPFARDEILAHGIDVL